MLIKFGQIWRNNVVFLDSFFVWKLNFASPGTKIHEKRFKVKARPIWQFNPFIKGSLLKTVLPQLRFLAPPREQMKSNTVDFKLS